MSCEFSREPGCGGNCLSMATDKVLKDVDVSNKRRRSNIRRVVDDLTVRERMMARLAKQIGRGGEVIYHGTRALPKVMRSGKLMPPDLAECTVSFTRSPEVAAYFACLLGGKQDQHSPGVLILDKSSLRQRYRIEPYRYDDACNECEEIVWGRTINVRRHLLGVVSESHVSELLGRDTRQHLPLGFVGWPQAEQHEFKERLLDDGRNFVAEGRASVRRRIIQERESGANV
ncbi:hypothetical protein SAMN05443247_05422 [Bradyrhizobium erythrophlei]|nr:hypothetical protein SAMN05443247_05422 [Bradyrhizobium erythrophlei]